MNLYELLVSLKGITEDLVLRGAKAVALFGSIARGVDFIPCRSDIDVLVVSDIDDYQEYSIPFNGYEVKISIAYYSPNILYEMARKLHPLILHIYKASIVYYDDGVLASILHEIPRNITEYTVNVEKHSTVVALTLAIESLSLECNEKALDHIHHALRHLARTLIGKDKPVTVFPVYDSEALIVLEEVDRELGQVFKETRLERAKCKTSSRVVEKLLNKAWNLASRYLELNMPSLKKIIEECSSNGSIRTIKVPLITTRKDANTITITCGNTVVES